MLNASAVQNALTMTRADRAASRRLRLSSTASLRPSSSRVAHCGAPADMGLCIVMASDYPLSEVQNKVAFYHKGPDGFDHQLDICKYCAHAVRMGVRHSHLESEHVRLVRLHVRRRERIARAACKAPELPPLNTSACIGPETIVAKITPGRPAPAAYDRVLRSPESALASVDTYLTGAKEHLHAVCAPARVTDAHVYQGRVATAATAATAEAAAAVGASVNAFAHGRPWEASC